MQPPLPDCWLKLLIPFYFSNVGYKYFANDLQAIGRLRGQVLKKLDVLKSEMILMSFGPSRREIEQVRKKNNMCSI